MPRMQTATGNEPPGVLLHVFRHKAVDLGGESDHFRRHIIYEYGAVQANRIHVFEKSFGGADVFGDARKIRTPPLHQLQRCRHEHFDGLYMDVAVGDHDPAAAASTARLAKTFMISRRYSGVSAEVVSGLAMRTASSPTSAANSSFMLFPIKAWLAPRTSRGAGLTAVIATLASSIGKPFNELVPAEVPFPIFKTTA